MVTALSAELRQARLDKNMGLRRASIETGLDAVLFNHIENGIELAPVDDGLALNLSRFMGIQMDTYRGLARLHNQVVPEQQKENSERMSNFRNARDAIVATKKNRGNVECPRCGKRLQFSVAYNGHIYAVCETLGCMSWIE